MIGAIALVLFMVLLFPVGFFLTGAVASGLHGELLTKDAINRFEGSELLDLQ
jgi:hypothetical protein